MIVPNYWYDTDWPKYSEIYHKAYVLGFEAARNGNFVDNNPYLENVSHEHHYWWNMGWGECNELRSV